MRSVLAALQASLLAAFVFACNGEAGSGSVSESALAAVDDPSTASVSVADLSSSSPKVVLHRSAPWGSSTGYAERIYGSELSAQLEESAQGRTIAFHFRDAQYLLELHSRVVDTPKAAVAADGRFHVQVDEKDSLPMWSSRQEYERTWTFEGVLAGDTIELTKFEVVEQTYYVDIRNGVPSEPTFVDSYRYTSVEPISGNFARR